MNPAPAPAPGHDRVYPLKRAIAAAVLCALLAACTTAGGPSVDSAPAAEANALGPDDNLRRAEQALGEGDYLTAAREFTLAAEQSDSVALAERATQFAFTAGYDAWAERGVRRWLELLPDSPLPRELYGRLLLRRHQLEEAVYQFGQALGAQEPRRDELYLALAADLAGEPNVELVTRVFTRLAAQDPYAPGAQLALGNAALRSGEPALALHAARAAGVDDPEWLEPRLLTARAMAASGDVDGAIDVLDGIAESGAEAVIGDPRDEDEPVSTAEEPGDRELGTAVLFEKARLLAAAERADEAARLLDRLRERVGEQPPLVRLSALLALASGDFDAARLQFQFMAEAGEGDEAHFYLGQVASLQGDAERALTHYGRVGPGALALQAHFAMAEILRNRGEIDGALALIDTFGRENPVQRFDTLGYRAQVLQFAGRMDEALATLDEALTYKPANVPTLVTRGAVREAMGRPRAALEDLGYAAAIAPADASALNAYGYTLANQGRRTREAYDYVRRAIELQPGSGPVQDSMGWALFRLGRLPEARSWLEDAYAGMPDPEIGAHLAEVWWRLGERDRARELLEATLVEHPDSAPARDTARRLLRR